MTRTRILRATAVRTRSVFYFDEVINVTLLLPRSLAEFELHRDLHSEAGVSADRRAVRLGTYPNAACGHAPPQTPEEPVRHQANPGGTWPVGPSPA